ncbi:MAG TPA: hypothetical protein VKT77_10580 [Chthonomonadaceae bacterium]|nr:hypothetical protein [Chthonomonadaceae bacterium]
MTDPLEKTIQKLQIEVILLSMALLAGAMIWTMQIGMAANKIDHELDHAGDALKELRLSVQKLEAKRA